MPSDRKYKLAATVFAVAVHLFAIVVLYGAQAAGGSENKGIQLEAIEAGLARRAKSKKGRKKSKIVRKEVDQKAKAPEGPKVTRNDKTEPKPKDDKKKKKNEPPPPEMVDPSSVFDKYRDRETPGEAEQVGSGNDEDDVQGRDDGSDWGLLDDPKGDPYLAELQGHFLTNPEPTIPTVVPEGTGLLTRVCIRMNKKGQIVSREIPAELKSKNPTFNRAVFERARIAQDMPEPVPEHLLKVLVNQKICIGYRY